MLRRFCLAAATAAPLLAAASSASALSCMVPPPPAEAFERVDVLFEGVAVEQEGFYEADLYEVDRGAPMMYHTKSQEFRVLKVYKGEIPAEVTVLLPGEPWAYEFEAGRTHVVAATQTPRGLAAGPCSLVKGGPAALRDWILSGGVR